MHLSVLAILSPCSSLTREKCIRDFHLSSYSLKFTFNLPAMFRDVFLKYCMLMSFQIYSIHLILQTAFLSLQLMSGMILHTTQLSFCILYSQNGTFTIVLMLDIFSFRSFLNLQDSPPQIVASTIISLPYSSILYQFRTVVIAVIETHTQTPHL